MPRLGHLPAELIAEAGAGVRHLIVTRQGASILEAEYLLGAFAEARLGLYAVAIALEEDAVDLGMLAGEREREIKIESETITHAGRACKEGRSSAKAISPWLVHAAGLPSCRRQASGPWLRFACRASRAP